MLNACSHCWLFLHALSGGKEEPLGLAGRVGERPQTRQLAIAALLASIANASMMKVGLRLALGGRRGCCNLQRDVARGDLVLA